MEKLFIPQGFLNSWPVLAILLQQ